MRAEVRKDRGYGARYEDDVRAGFIFDLQHRERCRGRAEKEASRRRAEEAGSSKGGPCQTTREPIAGISDDGST